MAAPIIPTLPPAPSRQDPSNFSAKSDALLAAFPNWVVKSNELGSWMNTTALSVESHRLYVQNNVPLMNNAVAAALQALGYRDTAKSYKESAEAAEAKAYRHAQDVASAVVYQDLASTALSKNITMVDGCIDTSPNPSLAVQRRTSWYNETLGTATRGTRRDIPTRKVVIAEANKVTIFDGDDPALPMWMVFDRGTTGSTYHILESGSVSSVVSRNGWLAVGTTANAVLVLNFAAETAEGFWTGGRFIYTRPFSQRNTLLSRATISGNSLRSNEVHDVAMTVLADAPIDPASGLQIPTIAVATTAGVSVILSSGEVFDIFNSDTSDARSVFFLRDGRIACQLYDDSRGYRIFDIPTADVSQPLHYTKGSALEWYESNKSTNVSQTGDLETIGSDAPGTAWPLKIAEDGHNLRIGNYGGLSTLSRDLVQPEKGMVAYTTHDYATGWMVGDIKGAWLSSTDAEQLTGGELIDTSIGPAGSNYLARGTLTSLADGYWRLDGNDPVPAVVASEDGIIEEGQHYVVTLDVSAFSGAQGAGISIRESHAQNSSVSSENIFNSVGVGKYVAYITGTGRDTLTVFSGTDGSSATFKMSVRRAERDRSKNKKGLIINGAVSLAPVAAGAELIGYSGFSGENYLEQPYNPDLDFGTGDFCAMGWVRSDTTGGSTQALLKRLDSSGVGFNIERTTSGGATHVNSLKLGLVTSTKNHQWAQGLPDTIMAKGAWCLVGLARQNGEVFYIFNGEIIHLLESDGDISATDAAPVVIGRDNVSSNDMSMALWRIGATAPTTEQLAKIYYDERAVFYPDAKVTLNGTSDVVRAMDCDETTGLVYVGTSDGRSDFAGLVRVGQTDTPITTKIVAHDGMILEK
tara:strand:+ start:2129 stop:4720 length:2592 start_codon:yes stop_codon:yes gene_type:complete